MQRRPTISVITAVYNARQTLPTALESLRAQTEQDIEHLVIDGASSDGTAHWLAERSHMFSRLVSEPDQGVYHALNKGVAMASGDVLGFLHADDLLAGPEVLSQVADAFTDPGVDIVYGDLLYVRRDDPTRVVRYWRAGGFAPGLLASGWMPPHPTVYMRRSLYERWGGFDTRWRIAADYEHILRVFKQPGLGIVYLPEVLVHMRTGGISNRSLGNLVRKSGEDWRALQTHGLGGALSVLRKNLSKLPQFVARAHGAQQSRGLG